jgi:cell division protease FtsH
MSRFFKSAAFPILIVVVLAFFAQKLIGGTSHTPKPTFGQLVTYLQNGEVKSISLDQKDLSASVTLIPSEASAVGVSKFSVGYPNNYVTQLIKLSQTDLAKTGAGAGGLDVSSTSSSDWLGLLTTILPFLIFIGLWIFLMNQVQGGGSKVMSFGKSRAKRLSVDSPKITFRDVAGVDEAVEELHEIKEFLENPKKFQALGARIPKGVLLYGPPGTGKTLLARAVAGEAHAAFFSISASEFIEAIVGVGASRVRDLFAKAKEAAPSIIFIDELDAIGRSRQGSVSVAGANDEREQTLNQILTEMDGFESVEAVVVLAATNRAEILDSALLRPGRFDRRVAVQPPDRVGRRKILEVHTRSIPLADGVDLEALAATTPGMVGADLANLANEAALLAARRDHHCVQTSDFTDSLEKILLGAPRGIVLSAADRERTAYHEAGHALVGMLTPGADPVRKVSIIPRGSALGVTLSAPDDDQVSYTREALVGKIDVALGGRVAEEIVYGTITTGAESDIEHVTAIARQMIGRWGMSDAIGFVTVLPAEGRGPFMTGAGESSEGTQRIVDEEMRRMIDAAHGEVTAALTAHRDQLETLARALLEHETLDEIDAYAAAQMPTRPAGAIDAANGGSTDPVAIKRNSASGPPPTA